VTDLSGKNFGLLIAYVLPGFVTLWGLSGISPTIDAWLRPAPTIPAGIASVVFVLLASVTAGMAVGALRWAVIDSLHHHTGLTRPDWDDANLSGRVDAFDTVVEAHYRYYQFYANMAVAIPLVFASHLIHTGNPGGVILAATLVLEILFVATSRDTLRKYYARSARLLGSLPRAQRSDVMSNGNHPPKTPPPTKPSSEEKKTQASGK